MRFDAQKAHVSDAIRKLNPHLFPALFAAQPEHDSERQIARENADEKGCTASVDYRVTIIACQRRLLDTDNLAGGAKFLRDAIARSLGQDDSDIAWEYGQHQTSGAEGTVVIIQSS